MSKEFYKEKASLYKTLATVFWGSSFLVGGALFKVIFEIDNIFKIIIFTGGSILFLFLLVLSIYLMYRCKKLLKELL